MQAKDDGSHPVTPQLLGELKSYECSALQMLQTGGDDPFVNIGESQPGANCLNSENELDFSLHIPG